LRRRVYADLFTATWGGWDEARHARHFAGSMSHGHISIIEVDGTPVGMIQLLERTDTVELRELQVDPLHQGRGIGTSVLADVLGDARARGKDVLLSVGVKNEKAIRLYRRLGFTSEGESETHRDMRCRPLDRASS
jgi:ribosomal protein S18 acetylase RimI-like enzyme